MPKRLRPLARTLRRDATRAKRRLWQGLRREQVAGFRFPRQVRNEDVFRNLDGVLETIRIRLIELRPRLEDPAT